MTTRVAHTVGLGVIIVVLVAMACARSPREKAPSAEQGAKVTFLKMERGSCYGICPVYALTVYKDGAVDFEGKHHVKVRGRASAHLQQEQMSELARAVKAASFDSLQPSYERVGVTDRATVVLSIARDDASKTVRHYLGDDSAPASLVELEDAIERIVQVEQWTGSSAERLQHAADWQ